jgi:hypothetical protein
MQIAPLEDYSFATRQAGLYLGVLCRRGSRLEV